MSTYIYRGLEMHSNRMWHWSAVESALELMSQIDLNMLIFHQNDLIDQLVMPKTYIDDNLAWERWPIRYATSVTSLHYLQQVIRETQKRNIKFFLEIKEIWYHESLLELFPQLRNSDGSICSTDPFWFKFLNLKITELFSLLPEIDGLIVSAATRESKISISTSNCKCERCRTADHQDWYEKMINSIYSAMKQKKKKLIIRDFAYSADQQDGVLAAAANVSDEIIAGLKNVPHDFWPTFPNNPRIGNAYNLRQWIEYDVWGQYCGLGVFPCSLVEDLKRRLKYAVEHGAEGIWFRTDWEIINEASVFNSMNMLNLIAGARLAKNTNYDIDSIYKEWVQYGLLSALTTDTCNQKAYTPEAKDAWIRLKSFMKVSWRIIEKTLYIRGMVFQYSSRYQHSLSEINNVMFLHHKRDTWEPGISNVVDPTDDNIAIILNEKIEAFKNVNMLSELLSPETLGLPEEFVAELQEILDLYKYYVMGYKLSAEAWCYVRKTQEKYSEDNITAAKEAIKTLEIFAHNLCLRLNTGKYPFYVYWMMDNQELLDLSRDLLRNIDLLINDRIQ